MFDLKFPPVLKGAIYSMPWETYLHLATLDSTDGNSAQMRRIWVVGIHKLANTVSLPPCQYKPEHCWTYDATLQSTAMVYGASEFELKVICVIGNSTIFLLVASVIMEKIKRYSYDVSYELNVMLPDSDRFPAASNIWPFLILAGILNQTLDIFILISRIRRTWILEATFHRKKCAL